VDTTVLVWDVTDLAGRAKRAPVELSSQEMSGVWDDLASEDAARAYTAMVKLSAGRGVMAFLASRLRPAAPVDGARLAGLLKDLNSDGYETRQKATTEIEKIGDQAESALRELLKGKPALEARQRVERLLARIATPVGEQIQALRAMEALEHSGDESARRLLTELASGTPQARQTREARESLERLTRAVKGR
jgi:hypothetical protein